MPEVLQLLRPRLWAFRVRPHALDATRRRTRIALIGGLGVAFWAAGFLVFYRVLVYFQGIEGFGDLLAAKLLSMVMVTFFALLLFSAVIAILSKLYLSRDLLLVYSLPVEADKVFLARWIESTLDSAWMVLVYSFPVLLSYGIVYRQGVFFYLTAFLAVFLLCLTASALSALLVLVAAMALPAGKIRTLLILFGVLLLALLILAIRLLQPEGLVNPDGFTALVLYLRSLETPGSPFLPTTWIVDALQAALIGDFRASLFHLALAGSFCGTVAFLAFWIAGAWYFQGYTNAQTAPERLLRGRVSRRPVWMKILSPLPGAWIGLILKEVQSFRRDQTQWPQVFLLGALILVYLYNFSVLPLDRAPLGTVYLQNLLVFLNMGLAAFVLTAIAARFVFPSVSMEGGAFWIIQAAPVSLRTFLWIKFCVYCLPLLLLAQILTVATNILLRAAPFMMGLSVATAFCLVPGIVALAVGLGAAYPDFHSEPPPQSVTSFGGVLFMILCAAFVGGVVFLEAGPVYAVVMAGLRGRSLEAWQWFWLVGALLSALALCILATIAPMRFGERRLRASFP